MKEAYQEVIGETLTRIRLEFCACGVQWKYDGTISEGWNICKNCGMDQRKLPLRYRPKTQTLWDWRTGITEEGQTFIENEGRVTEIPTVTSVAELLWMIEQDALTEKARKVKTKEPIIPSPPMPMDILIDMLTSGETYDDCISDEGQWIGASRRYQYKNIGDDPRLIEYLRPLAEKGQYSAYFSYPKSHEEGVRRLFQIMQREPLLPLSDPKPDTKTARGECKPRGGCGGVIKFPCPEDVSILKQYPKAYDLARDRNRDRGNMIEFQDYKLALRLFYWHKFPLKGKTVEK
jgi:hypothetical protein